MITHGLQGDLILIVLSSMSNGDSSKDAPRHFLRRLWVWGCRRTQFLTSWQWLFPMMTKGTWKPSQLQKHLHPLTWLSWCCCHETPPSSPKFDSMGPGVETTTQPSCLALHIETHTGNECFLWSENEVFARTKKTTLMHGCICMLHNCSFEWWEMPKGLIHKAMLCCAVAGIRPSGLLPHFPGKIREPRNSLEPLCLLTRWSYVVQVSSTRKAIWPYSIKTSKQHIDRDSPSYCLLQK